MNTLNDQLKNWKDKNKQFPATKKKEKSTQMTQKSLTDKLSDRDIKELMGMNRPRYEKRRGSIRQR
jgi:hypothetical protein